MEKTSSCLDSLSKVPGTHYDLDDFYVVVEGYTRGLHRTENFIHCLVRRWNKSVAMDMLYALQALVDEYGPLRCHALDKKQRKFLSFMGFVPAAGELAMDHNYEVHDVWIYT